MVQLSPFSYFLHLTRALNPETDDLILGFGMIETLVIIQFTHHSLIHLLRSGCKLLSLFFGIFHFVFCSTLLFDLCSYSHGRVAFFAAGHFEPLFYKRYCEFLLAATSIPTLSSV